MGRTIPQPTEDDRARAVSLVMDAGPMAIDSIAQMIAEIRWLRNLMHTNTITPEDVEDARENGFNEGFDQGFFEGQQNA